ncbi:rod shape-determining protein RodA [bacterium]|nr:rod shape-determining protein RodA [bacterium]
MLKLIDRNVDYGIIFAVLVLLIAGIVMIHSASTGQNTDVYNIWQKQVVWAVLSVAVMLAVVMIPLKVLYVFSYLMYGLFLMLLILTEIHGSVGGGSERWLNIGPVRFQPSEFMKIATILALARYLSIKKNRPTTYKKVIIPIIIVFIPMGLISKQPDLGTSLVFFAIIFPMLYWAGLDTVRLFFLVAPILSAIFSAPFIPFFNWVTWVIFMFLLLWVLYQARYTLYSMGFNIFINIVAGIATPYIFGKIKPYQQKRITTLFNPDADPLDSGYQLINSKIAIGSGGLFGKGIGQGKYTGLGFLPHSHTDFIFSVVGEEVGFIGAVVILGIVFYIVYRGIMLASSVKNPFISIAAIGISTVFMFHMFVNVGMAIGIMPVTGLPLLFLSYGGSSCLNSALMVGLLLNFSVNRHEY